MLLFLFRASGRVSVCVTYVNVEQICQTQNTFIVYMYERYMYAFIFNADAFFMAVFPRKKNKRNQKNKAKRTHTTFSSQGRHRHRIKININKRKLHFNFCHTKNLKSEIRNRQTNLLKRSMREQCVI